MIRTIRRTAAQRAFAAAGLLASGALLLTGCSSSSAKSATAAPSASASAGGSTQFAAYRTCLSQHGVTMPTGRPSGHFSGSPSNRPTDRPSGGYGGGFGGGTSANPSEAAAAKACASFRPTGGFGGGAAGGTAMKAFTSCMKDNGVTVTGSMRSLSTTDPKTAAALKICKALLPTHGGGSPAPGATSSS